MSFLLRFFGVFKKLFSADLTVVFITMMIAIVAVVSLPLFGKFAGFLGYETKETLREQVRVEKKNIDTLSAVVKEQTLAVKVLEGTVDNTAKTLGNKLTKDQTTFKKIAQIQIEREEKIQAIEQLELPVQEKVEKISEIRIISIWQAYCTATEAQQCDTELQNAV